MKFSSLLPLACFLALVPACASPVDEGTDGSGGADGVQPGKTSEAVTGVHTAIRDGQWHTFYYWETSTNPYCPAPGWARIALTYRAYGSHVDVSRIDIYNTGSTTFTDGEIDGATFPLLPPSDSLGPYQSVTVLDVHFRQWGFSTSLPLGIPISMGEANSSPAVCDLAFNVVLK